MSDSPGAEISEITAYAHEAARALALCFPNPSDQTTCIVAMLNLVLTIQWTTSTPHDGVTVQDFYDGVVDILADNLKSRAPTAEKFKRSVRG